MQEGGISCIIPPFFEGFGSVSSTDGRRSKGKKTENMKINDAKVRDSDCQRFFFFFFFFLDVPGGLAPSPLLGPFFDFFAPKTPRGWVG